MSRFIRSSTRLRANDPNPGEALKTAGEGVGDLVLDFLCAVPAPVREDDDLVIGEIRDRVDGCRGDSPRPPHGEGEVHGHDHRAIPEAEFG